MLTSIEAITKRARTVLSVAIRMGDRQNNDIENSNSCRQRVGSYGAIDINNGQNEDQRYEKLKKWLIVQGVLIACLFVTTIALAAGFGAAMTVFHLPTNSSQIVFPYTPICYQETSSCDYSGVKNTTLEFSRDCSTEYLLINTKVST